MQQVVERALKRMWHRDLASDPVTHAWVLNLYRAGERHPQTVKDYFPHAHAPYAELAAKMQKHERDEERHTKMYTRAIEGLDQPVVDLDGYDVFNEVIRDKTSASFAIAETDTADQKREKVAHFLAHAHFLEKRIARSLEYHVEACRVMHRDRVATVVESVLADELEHVAYTLEAARDLLTRERAEEVIDLHRRGEAKANYAFSRHQVKRGLSRFANKLARSHKGAYALAGVIMLEAERRV
jgi:hypothetical protein